MRQKQVFLFDTTLRDGQQCPGAGMSFKHNLEYAHLAARLGIDVLEAGFAAASQTDYDIVSKIVEEIAPIEEGPMIASLCQLRKKQIETTIEVLEPGLKYHKSRLHTYLPVDPNLMEASLGDYAHEKNKILMDVYTLVSMAAQTGLQVEFSPEGYSRMGENFDFTTDVIRAAVSAGATVINCPDTIGGASHREGKNYFVEHMKIHAAIISQEFPGKNIIWSAHCHNDLGLALENSMNAVFDGPVTQIEGCINGIGERAGNVSLEQCIVYLKQFGKGEIFCRANSEYIQPISDFVAQHMLTRQRHWPVTGENAACHTSGGHTNAILKNPMSYQPFDPREMGKEISFMFGPLSGGNHAKAVIEKQGYRCEENEKADIAQFIKSHYADRRKGITDEELIHAYLLYRETKELTV